MAREAICAEIFLNDFLDMIFWTLRKTTRDGAGQGGMRSNFWTGAVLLTAGLAGACKQFAPMNGGRDIAFYVAPDRDNAAQGLKGADPAERLSCRLALTA